MDTCSGHAPGPGGIRHISGPPFCQVSPTKIFIAIPVANCHVNKNDSNKHPMVT